ncbi:MAG: hypothetical protein JWN46_2714 [Acidimicrobiales bacterium]|nr:hypothetical protein [Acidimicrobiales bacterium]
MIDTLAPDPATATPRPAPAAATPRSAQDEAERAAALARMKRFATGLLIAMTVVFVIARAFENRHPWVGYVRATAEAAMVGALADWFAVTALFKHPLGLPIPHTAIIPNRKDDIGRGLGTFVQGNFLSGPVLAEKIRSLQIADRIADHLTDPANAERLAATAGDAIRAVAEVLRDEDVAPAVEEMIDARLRALPAAPLAARMLEAAVEDGHHQVLLDTLLKGTARMVDKNRDLLRQRLDRESPWWVPDAVDDRIFTKLYDGMQRFLEDVASDPDHEVRGHIDERARALVEELRDSPEMAARGEEIKAQLLENPALRTWSASLWTDLKGAMVDASADPDSELRRRLADGIVRFGETLRADPELRAKIDRGIERAVIYLLEQYRDEVADLISGTVARWDAEDASRRIELQVGRDLQYIRINGTVVGGLAGLVIFTISRHLF